MAETKQDETHPDEGNPVRSRPDLEPTPADDALAEVRAVRAGNEARAATHNRVTVDREVQGVEGSLRVSAADGRVFLDGEGSFDQDGLISVQHALAAAFQAVS